MSAVAPLSAAREALRLEYLAAYQAANPGRPEPSLVYERGWWVLRFASTGNAPSRHRTAELRWMLATLRARDACE